MKRQLGTYLFLASAGFPLAAAQQTTPPAAMNAPAAPTQYSGHSRIEQLNYNREGAVNGFLTADGVLVFIPPMDNTAAAAPLQKGSTVDVTGMRRQTMNGRKVVDAQTLKAGDQTIVFAMRGPGRPGGPPPRPRRWNHGPGQPPPPPPPPSTPPEPPE